MGLLLKNEPLSRHTSWRVGGTADSYYEPESREDLAEFIRNLPTQEPILWMGLGSNLLVRDAGVRGTVISLHGALDKLEKTSETGIYAEAGVHCARLAKFVVNEKLAGAGFFGGIPGTVGGALAMNAGAHGGETWNAVHEVEVMFHDGHCEWLPRSEFRFSYRHVDCSRAISGFIAARFRFALDHDGMAEKDMKEWLARRKATQPVGKPSAGSTFRNPAGDHAARLIEACGLKGHRIGSAMVSALHANFIITDEGARAADVEALIAHIRSVVKQKTGVELETEIKIVGEAGHA